MTTFRCRQNHTEFRANAHVRQLYCRTTMPTYLYFGEDEFFLTRTIKQLKTHILDQQWANFNYTEYLPESKETIPQALIQQARTLAYEVGVTLTSDAYTGNYTRLIFTELGKQDFLSNS